jgi:hypothetical protein
MAWIIITLALMVQELASSGAALLLSQKDGFNPWIIHAIWLAATTFDISIGFYLGKWIQREFKNSKVDRWAERWAVKIERAIGTTGTKISLAFLAFVTYPYAGAFAASWLPAISLVDVFIFTLIGNFFWYLFEWATVLGIAAAGSHYQIIFIIIAFAGIAFVAIANTVKKRLKL